MCCCLFIRLCFSLFFIYTLQLSAQSPKSKPIIKPNDGSTIVYDTIFKGWVTSYDKKVLVWSFRSDGKGNYFVIRETPDGERVFRFSNNKWEDIQGNLKKPRILIFDEKNNTYLITDSAGYKLNGNDWQKVWENYKVFYLGFGRDGNLYGDIVDPRDSKQRFVLKYEGGKWNYIGNEPFLRDKYHRAIDQNGNIYLADNIAKENPQNFRLRKWTKATGSWSVMDAKMGPVSFLGIDKYNSMYLQQYNDYYSRWDLKRYNPSFGWERFLVPATLHPRDFKTELINNEIYVRGPMLENENEIVVYRLDKGKWVLEAKWKGKPSISSFASIAVSGKEFFLASEDSVYRYDRSPLTITANKRFSILPIPLEGVSSSTPEIGKHYNRIGLYRENGKWGVRINTGSRLIFPIFDTITIAKSPSKFYYDEVYDYAFHLKMGNTEFYTALKLDFPERLEGFISKMEPCNRCGGSGKLPDETIKVLVKGKWVPDKSSSTYIPPKTSVERRWNPTTKQYVDVTTTSGSGYYSNSGGGGHYEKDSYQTEKIKGGVCDVCKGKPYMITREVYIFNPATKKYELTLEVIADEKNKYK